MNDIDFVCISLHNRTDRQRAMLDFFNKLNVKPHWWIITKHPQNGRYGCFESHYFLIRNFVSSKKYVCILEDDLKVPTSDQIQRFHTIVNNLNTILSSNEICNLSDNVVKYNSHVNIASSYIVRGFVITAHAYIVRNDMRPQIASRLRPYFGWNVDVAMANEFTTCCIYPYIFEQNSEMGSDNASFGAPRKLYHINMFEVYLSLFRSLSTLRPFNRLCQKVIIDHEETVKEQMIDRRVYPNAQLTS